MILNVKINYTAWKILCSDAGHRCDCVQNIMAPTGRKNNLFEIFYGGKPKIICLFSYFGRIAYITKEDKIKKIITDKT